MMKKYISWFLSLACILTLAACGKKAAPIVLPEIADIASVDVTVGEDLVTHADKTWISEMIFDISSSRPTGKESVQDIPQVESYIKLDIRFDAGSSTLFAYEDNGKYYVEQPYHGIYEIDSQVYEQLK